ncbi:MULTISPECIES: ribonucleotide-diphosphate reductase subunit beta [Psychrilyobacter]|uniref:Ribonucleoside-diphosphate reductase subunit beta n=1 Tax=Psychrilyobacter piezotolerans TaxID=2293438 RepID=A0ABX9KJ64_9FUSO|nr:MULTISPECIES: ribonucleotide-diphosphate reductase subunit beta [Psychrilyobacter]MCS5421826.1 ribonucleotide-diphosphate reductase subunit beta [Psychrilyobacter sp. S5]NDI77576.1 ribonucleotide-diphosphate reductase subunit beta [Psychrilyobacter piezotolerans]RDE63006.1 ribonucleotide-diphosphate reductase subunit beta [Psychrilyobacter sp. S5]REI41764.1 ribonucleotide-diphosphate reductase subunit beta [Psychrilyobacter piezotolerans]
MDRKKIFNPCGTDSLDKRKIIGGDTTNIFNLNNVKYQWANNLYRTMMGNFWIPEKTDLTQDKNDYVSLVDEEKDAYDGILSFLVFLDSIQTNNIPNISNYITAPEVNLILAIQTYQEAIHSQSYQYIIESILPREKRNLIYDKWRDDEVLFERNQYIAKIYQDFIDTPSNKNFARVLVANFLLESLYFYNGFNFFYLLASRNKMMGTSDIIKLINRDELSHVALFQNMINEIRQENIDYFSEEEIYGMFQVAVEQEIRWSKHIIGKKILGVTEKTIEDYTKWLANERLRSLGLNKLYRDYEKNPYKHLEKLADTEGEGNVKANFFEGNVTSYNMSSSIEGWDEL